MEGIKTDDLKRGEVCYIAQIKTVGSEQGKARPAIIVSNDICNRVSPTIEVVYITTVEKKWLPTHVRIFGATDSIALCEQITTVDKKRIYRRCGLITKQEMWNIDRAIEVSLGLKRLN